MLLWLIIIFANLSSCKTQKKGSLPVNEGLLVKTTRLFNNEGDTVFNYPLQVWYRDSTAIEMVVSTHSMIDTNDVVTVTHPLGFCRYIDLRRDSMYDFRTLSDTATLLRRVALPDSIMKPGGWAYYSKKIHIIKETPVFIGDTTINGQTWKLGIFKYSGYNQFPDNKRIGFFRCGEPYTLFSLAHGYYEQSGCRLDRLLDYFPGHDRPSGDIEITHLSSQLPDSVRTVFDRWEERIRNQQ